MEPVLPSGEVAGEATSSIPTGPLAGKKVLVAGMPAGTGSGRNPDVVVQMPDGTEHSRGPRGGILHENVAAQAAPLNVSETGAHRFRPVSQPGLQNELPWHTMAAYMMIAGRTNVEIAMAAGVCEQSVSNLRAQLWFQQRLATIANNDGEEVLASFKAKALAAAERIEVLAVSAEKDSVRLAANTYIVNQSIGSPVQKTLNINANAFSGLSPQEEYQRTQDELRALRAARSSGPA